MRHVPPPDSYRKLKLLADLYRSRVHPGRFKPSIREAHAHMFGLTLFEDRDVTPQSYLRSRSGLIVTEAVMGLLNLDVSPEKFGQGIATQPCVSVWADIAAREWTMTSPERTPGRWWIYPVLYHVSKRPPSTVRLVGMGLEAMGIVAKQSTKTPTTAIPKARPKSIRLTTFGETVLQQLENGKEI
jgi:hypothetical protein